MYSSYTSIVSTDEFFYKYGKKVLNGLISYLNVKRRSQSPFIPCDFLHFRTCSLSIDWFFTLHWQTNKINISVYLFSTVASEYTDPRTPSSNMVWTSILVLQKYDEIFYCSTKIAFFLSRRVYSIYKYKHELEYTFKKITSNILILLGNT